MDVVRLAIGLLAGLMATVLVVPEAMSLPRMSATSGAPCSTCHYSPDGSGIRTEIGFGNQLDMAAFDYGDIGIGFLADQDTNKALDWLAVGGDIRIQTARPDPDFTFDADSGRSEVELADRRIFPMQFEPQIAVFATDWLTFTGSWAMGPDIGDGDLCSGAYPGQMCGHAQAVVRPGSGRPTVRAGMIRPNTGIQHDDHTMLVEADASRPDPTVIPPNYAEVGAEASYQPAHWFRADAGAFRSDQLADAIGDPEMVQASDPALMARAAFYPRFDVGSDYSFYGWAGASVYGAGQFRGAGDFRMDQAFFGLGWLDQGSLMVELAHLDFDTNPQRRALNASTTLSVEIYNWLIAEGRVEQATTFRDDSTDIRRSAIAGLQVYPLPFIKLRPEYRYTRTDQWEMGQYMVQLHLFY